MSSRMPVHMIERNQDLLKSQSLSGGEPGATDYRPDLRVPEGEVARPRFSAAPARTFGNVLFRRYPDGTLDVQHAVDTIMDILRLHRDKSPLTDLQKMALGCVFPTVFATDMDEAMIESMRRVHLKLSPMEAVAIAMRVGAEVKEQLNFNAGYGGGSVPGRSQTRS